jgi:hypothetical protein
MAFNLETFLEEAFVFKEDLFRSLVQLRDRDDELEGIFTLLHFFPPLVHGWDCLCRSCNHLLFMCVC